MVSPRTMAMMFSIALAVGALAASESSNKAVSSTAGGSIIPTGISSTTSAVSATLASSFTSAASSSATKPPTEASRSTLPISYYSFTPFPTPAQSAVSGGFPSSDPKNPPPVHSDLKIIPNFAPAWAVAYKKAKAKIANFTLEEKVNVTTGVGWMGGRCAGNIAAIEPIDGRGWPGLCLENSPLGVSPVDYATVFPAGINAAATWNRRLMRLRGLLIGREHVGKGVNVALGPMMNMGRQAQGGRNWEGFGADPFLSGEAAYETILGLQSAGVQACAKHYINNDQEHNRTTSSSDVDDRTQHEIYAQPFLRSVMAGLTSVMCSYNLINDTYACENDKMLNDVLKREFGFQGYVMSDWDATMSTLSAIAGLDMTMPGGIGLDVGDVGTSSSYFGGNLTAFVNNGTIPLSRIDDMATRILAGWYFLGQDAPSYPQVNFNIWNPYDDSTNGRVDVQDDHYKVVREIGAASTVLLKNDRGALPLKKPRSLVLIGNDAGPGRAGPNQFQDQGGSDGTLAVGWGSGSGDFTYLITPLEAIQARARQHRTSVSWLLDNFDLPMAGNVAIRQSAALVFINSDSGEGYITVNGNEGDRKNLTAWHGGDALVLAVAAQNNNTIVIVHSVGPLIVEPWIEHPNVTAVLWAGLPGSESGYSITEVLYGDWNPSGRLPYTIARNASDYPAHLVFGGDSTDIVKINYTEGLLIDYRHFDAKHIHPRFEFGFGLSYTSFHYTDMMISKMFDFARVQCDEISNWEAGNSTRITEGSSTALWLHEPAYRVTFSVENTGKVYGGDIPQLYVNFPPSSGEPPSVLKGFINVEVNPGQKVSVTITLSRHDLSIWDVADQGWRKPQGNIRLEIGASSRDIRLRGMLP
ncbi:glycoside hydrolase family 3 protein [Piloderma croceum F 1598]|uniref:beta-glucosidase n=1 Tax=Piloderma croceum (strain F 1598) TaxID=765440 RepID=A0A0C3ETT8_PILCF|nr:glycoside hydrolase family 3 protein [Piloderma croceum F 1598]